MNGSTFYFNIPCAMSFEDVADNATILSRSNSIQHNSGVTDSLTIPTFQKDLSGIKILVVDDSIVIQKGLTRALRAAGCSVKCVGNGRECLDILQHDEFDVVLLDINMPVMDGLTCVAELRRLEATSTSSHYLKHQFVVGMSANLDHGLSGMYTDAGMDVMEAKPLLVEVIQRHINTFGIIELNHKIDFESSVEKV